MSNTVNNNSEDINEIDMLKFIKNCLESVTINESHKRITEYLYNFFVRQKENCEKQIGKVPKKQSKRLNFRHGYKNPRPHFCNRSTLIIHI